MIQIVVFCIVSHCSDAVGYQHYGGPCYHHLQGSLKIGMFQCCLYTGSNMNEFSLHQSSIVVGIEQQES